MQSIQIYGIKIEYLKEELGIYERKFFGLFQKYKRLDPANLKNLPVMMHTKLEAIESIEALSDLAVDQLKEKFKYLNPIPEDVLQRTSYMGEHIDELINTVIFTNLVLEKLEEI